MLTVSNTLPLNSNGPLNSIIQCSVNMRALFSEVKVLSGTNAAFPDRKVQAMHFLRDTLHLGTDCWYNRSREKSLGFSKGSMGKTGKEVGKATS